MHTFAALAAFIHATGSTSEIAGTCIAQGLTGVMSTGTLTATLTTGVGSGITHTYRTHAGPHTQTP